ncbi:hypothetical protein [Helicobacter sp. L8]|uniref:hypothetical protein n=1 Tax=Helicobacter sp. L8 TaxID=2316078 RepID=UPI000EAEBD2C|nr:hypothetical protein [Helicobacter sp. L8]
MQTGQDFKQLAREMKAFFKVGSLDQVGAALGFSRGASNAWCAKQRFSDRALVKYYQLRAKGTPPPPPKEEKHADFKQLAREMKEFFEVGSLKEVAEKLGLSATSASNWSNFKKFPDHIVKKFHELRQQAPTQEGLFASLQKDTTPPPPPYLSGSG